MLDKKMHGWGEESLPTGEAHFVPIPPISVPSGKKTGMSYLCIQIQGHTASRHVALGGVVIGLVALLQPR